MTTPSNKVKCEKCGTEVTNGYMSRHLRFCGLEKKKYYNADKAKEYYLKNRDKILDEYKSNKEQKREYYQANAERIKERQAKYAEKNKDRIKEKRECGHCGKEVNKYYLKKHMEKCDKNPDKKCTLDGLDQPSYHHDQSHS
jgi:endogenous inhibitor of DNA gyrase (YacG/DUF329 family)